MDPAQPFGKAFIGPAANPRLNERAIKAEIDLRHTGGCRKLAVVFIAVAAQRPDVVKRACLEADEMVTADQIGTAVAGPCASSPLHRAPAEGHR